MVGNKPNYSQFDILRCLFRIEDGISRSHLAKSLELGEGTVRTVLDILKLKGLISSTKKGHFLSASGRNELSMVSRSISQPVKFESDRIYNNLRKSGLLVRDVDSVPNTYKLRDTAVRYGSEGAIILKFDKRLYAPESDKFDYSELEKCFELENGDVVILAFADSYAVAENSALAVASELSSELKNFINRLSN